MRCTSAITLSLLAAGAMALIATPARANLVSDPGFEFAAPGADAGSRTDYNAGSSFDGGDWTITQGTSSIDTSNIYVYNGEKALELTTGDGIDAVSQILNTVAGQTYTITFLANADTPNAFSLIFGTPVSAGPTSIVANGFPAGFVQYSATAVAISNLTPLTFLGINTMPDAGSTGHTVEIDDVSVESVTPTPEPASISIFGLIALAATRRARRRGFEI